ncbi:putative membrane protein involved in D-alanine export [Rivularia sp. PCC 7116]|uniref:MBOAT family O-acyltransferase n=1 Tax=Rivularia sp. PCC 7116 TaxID=373994 RepID=UPI00029EFA2C|nr:MBOAT family protein [Rivularia sp. PCC 7116]AFY57995.1 putative membrane protein involved in D-alanine export [Rivularia sp. PCC 7116]
MLFNSLEFIFLFLPIALLIFFQIGKFGSYRFAIVFLVAASLAFYGWWNPPYLLLLVFSLIFNFFIGSALSDKIKINFSNKLLLTLGIIVNLGLIGYFKYANFFVSSINSFTGTNFNIETIILPLAISFFTFQQIAYLVDAYKGETKEYNFLDYCLFVTFFPQLIAGPIVHHKEVMPQFADKSTYRFNPENMAVGITIFSLGLFKKVVFADNIAVYATPIFKAASEGVAPTLFEAWIAALAYTLQLYFDFSGYSDMAIGISRMFGIKLPINFNSPYKAISISDFWRRWHITLSNFLRDYLYITLGGSRQGEIRRNANLLITMLLGGLWHGAGWTFVFWGGLHGTYLIINHQYRSLRKRLGHDLKNTNWFDRGCGWLLTFVAVVVGWVFFRAESIDTALVILKGMIGLNGVSVAESLSGKLGFLQNWNIQANGWLPIIGGKLTDIVLFINFLLIITWFTPNTQQWMIKFNTTLEQDAMNKDEKHQNSVLEKLAWQPNISFSIIFGTIFFIAIKLILEAPKSEFLYFNF